MLVEMAVGARRIETQKRLSQVDVFIPTDLFVFNIFWYMALTAVQLAVFSVEDEARLSMVEILLSAFEIDQFEIPAMVFHVAQVALGVLIASVQACTGLTFVGNGLVAGEAFIRKLIAFGAVTFLTVFDAFENCVCAAQFPRRNLGPQG